MFSAALRFFQVVESLLLTFVVIGGIDCRFAIQL